jgi:predicted signal transduction protein with EAL and GGDEF domain
VPYELDASATNEMDTVSLGCATYPVDGQSSESLLGAADRALYEMKNGRQLQLFVSELFRIAASPPASDASSSEQDDSS